MRYIIIHYNQYGKMDYVLETGFATVTEAKKFLNMPDIKINEVTYNARYDCYYKIQAIKKISKIFLRVLF